MEARRLCCVCRLLSAGRDATCGVASIVTGAWVWGSVSVKSKSLCVWGHAWEIRQVRVGQIVEERVPLRGVLSNSGNIARRVLGSISLTRSVGVRIRDPLRGSLMVCGFWGCGSCDGGSVSVFGVCS